MARVLVVEDDESIRSGLVVALQHEGHQVAAYPHGGALEQAGLALPSVDVAIVDVGLPEGPDGIELARTLIGVHDIPVMVLTAQDDFEVKAAGYRVGADLYVTKPFSVTELLWQLTALLRRTGRDHRQLAAGPLTVDPAQRLAWHDGVELGLTPTEFDLLAVLLRHHGIVLSKSRLLELVWGQDVYDTNLVETTIRRLRGKLGERAPQLIETVRGAGYRLRSDS